MVADNHHQNLPSQSQPQSKLGRLRTGYAILGGPLAWALHFVVMYFLVQPICRLGGEVMFTIVTVVMALVALGAGIVAWRHRSDDSGFEAMVNGIGGWRSFVTLYGVVSSALFVYAIVYQWIPTLYRSACDGMRPLQ